MLLLLQLNWLHQYKLFFLYLHSYLLFFTDRGRVYRAKAHEIPKTNRTAKGSLIQNVLSMGQDEKVQAIIDTRDYETENFLLILTEKGTVKKSSFKDFTLSSNSICFLHKELTLLNPF